MKISFDIKNPENRQKILIAVFVIIILATVIVLYPYLQKQLLVFFPQISLEVSLEEPVVLAQELNLAPLENPIFKNLGKIGDYPVKIGESELGRGNPFTPY